MDIVVLALAGGREKSAVEFAALFERSGFKFTEIVSTPPPLPIVEAERIP